MITYRMVQEQVMARWEKFRRALREKDREAFDGMMGKARQHSSASSYNIQPDPTESMFMSILLEHEKKLGELEGKEKKDE